MVVWILVPIWATAAIVTAITVFLMLADTTNMSQTGHEGGDGTTAAATAAEGGGGGAELQPLQPQQPKSGARGSKSTKSTRSKSKSLMQSLKKQEEPEEPMVDEAEQQAIEDEQRAKLPPMLQRQSGMLSDNYDGYGPWTVWVPPPRAKECTADDRTKAKLLGHVAKCFEADTLLGKRYPFVPSDVAEVCDHVSRYLRTEPMLIEDLPYGIVVVADLHGQLYDLRRIFKHFEKDGKPAWECTKFLFLGDYVDRGRQSLEILMTLFSLKILYPDRIFLLRGNHEFLRINIGYGLHKELADRYTKKTSNEMFLYLNGVFTLLSVGAIIQDKYLCVHAGVSAHGFTRNNMRGIRKPYYWVNDDCLVADMVWADPAEGLRGTVFNGERQCSLYFGMDALVHSLYTIGAEILVRGHSCLTTGYSITGNGLCISLFSCTGSGGYDNDGSIMSIDDEGYYKVILMKQNQKRIDWERKLMALDDGFVTDEKDEKTVDPDGPTAPKKFHAQPS